MLNGSENSFMSIYLRLFFSCSPLSEWCISWWHTNNSMRVWVAIEEATPATHLNGKWNSQNERWLENNETEQCKRFEKINEQFRTSNKTSRQTVHEIVIATHRKMGVLIRKFRAFGLFHTLKCVINTTKLQPDDIMDRLTKSART